MKKLAIIVPERDRAEHMKIFVPFMQDLLDKEDIDYRILGGAANTVRRQKKGNGGHQTQNISPDVQRPNSWT